MKTFKDLQVGDKIYIEFHATFVHEIRYISVYLVLRTFHIKEQSVASWCYNEYYIPLNHIKANNAKIGGRRIFISDSKYKKYIMDFMKSQLKK